MSQVPNYPGNSNKNRPSEAEEEAAERKVNKVIEGTAVRKKASLGRRVLTVFVGDGEDSKGVWGYILYDVLAPAARDAVVDAVSGGVERALYGERGGGNRRSGGRRADGGTNYNNMSRQGHPGDPRTSTTEPRRDKIYDDIFLPTRAAAEQVQDGMIEIMSKYRIVTIADYYELCGVSSKYTDRAWGWDDLRGTDIRRRGGDYILELPRPIAV